MASFKVSSISRIQSVYAGVWNLTQQTNKQELSLSRPFPHSNHNRHHHSHSISLGAVNPNHRVTRRKSVTTTAASATNAAAAAAVAAASIKDSSGEPSGIPMPASSSARRGSSRKPFQESSSVGASSGFPSSSSYLSRSMNNPSTTAQDPVAANLSSAPNGPKSEQQPSAPNGPAFTTNGSSSPAPAPKNRNRRASEGSHLVKGEGKRSLAEIRCDRCGKGYKHGSCLSKHMCVSSPQCCPTVWLGSERIGAMLALSRSPSWSSSSSFLFPYPPFPPSPSLSWRIPVG